MSNIRMAANYLHLSSRLRFYCVVEMDLAWDSQTRGVSPYTSAMRTLFRQQLNRIGQWRDERQVTEDWRKMRVIARR